MLNNLDKLLTGELLKILCDMGHGDSIVIADANFPADTYSKRLVRLPGTNASQVIGAIKSIFPLDVDYSVYPVSVMDLTDDDKKKGLSEPVAWLDVKKILSDKYPNLEFGKIERFKFYECAKNAYAVISTGEERIYGNFILIKGCVL